LTRLGTPGSEENPPTDSNLSRSTDVVSRRSLRASRAQAGASGAVAASTPKPSSTRKPSSTPSSQGDIALRSADATKKAKKKVKGGVINVAVMTLAAGLIATMAIPAYAFNPAGANDAQFKTSAIDGMKKAQPQSVAVPQTVAASSVSRDAAGATTQAQLDAQKAARVAEVARQQAAVQLTTYAASYSGPSVTDFLANPPYPKFSLAQVFSVAQQYIGTPYVFGGSTPAGFDCSGYIMFVYSQFGISLPHSVSGQAARGKRISIQDAVPGDVVIMPGHDGFYAGNGNIMDAPDTGRSISIRPIWTSDYYIVRLGI
jgi:cell wall-associated NlpC family hydrolase